MERSSRELCTIPLNSSCNAIVVAVLIARVTVVNSVTRYCYTWTKKWSRSWEEFTRFSVGFVSVCHLLWLVLLIGNQGRPIIPGCGEKLKVRQLTTEWRNFERDISYIGIEKKAVDKSGTQVRTCSFHPIPDISFSTRFFHHAFVLFVPHLHSLSASLIFAF